MLAVVEHEQQMALGEVLAQRIDRQRVSALADAERGDDGLRDALGIGKRCQVDQPHAIGE